MDVSLVVLENVPKTQQRMMHALILALLWDENGFLIIIPFQSTSVPLT